MPKEDYRIEINPPRPNTSIRSEWFWLESKLGLYWPSTLEQMRNTCISLGQFPRLVDLGAGDGSAARLFKDIGWQDVTCIDWKKPLDTSNLVPDATWKYWNLIDVVRAMKDRKVEEKFLPYQGRFDLVIITYFDSSIDLSALGAFFARKGGLLYVPTNHEEIAQDTVSWRPYGNTEYFFQRI